MLDAERSPYANRQPVRQAAPRRGKRIASGSRWALMLLLVVVLAGSFGEPFAIAETPMTRSPTTTTLPPGFAPLPGAEARAQSVDANVLVVAAYSAFFLGLFVYVVILARKQAAVLKEISDLRAEWQNRDRR